MQADDVGDRGQPVPVEEGEEDVEGDPGEAYYPTERKETCCFDFSLFISIPSLNTFHKRCHRFYVTTFWEKIILLM